MQAGEVTSLKQCFARTYRADGLRGFLFGISSPLASIPIVNGIVFGAYGHANSIFTIESSFWKGVVSGSYAGLVNTFVVTPVELIKIKMQVQSNDRSIGQSMQYSSGFECMRKTIKSSGIRSLFKGTIPTVYREIPSYAMQFATFEISKSFFFSVLGENGVWSGLGIFLSGIIAGFNCWLWSYPQDVIKTKIQSGHAVVKGWDGGFTYMARLIWRTEGWRGFWRGFSACAIRATIPNGFGFLAHDLSMGFMNERLAGHGETLINYYF